MHPTKGFSLIEVLIALSLICSILMCLTEHQLQTHHTVNQLLQRVDASQALDGINEQSWSQHNREYRL